MVPNPEQGRGMEGYFTKASEGHRWCYFSEQQQDEALLFRQYDSEGATAVPHTAIATPGEGEGEVARESIEVRLFVVY